MSKAKKLLEFILDCFQKTGAFLCSFLELISALLKNIKLKNQAKSSVKTLALPHSEKPEIKIVKKNKPHKTTSPNPVKYKSFNKPTKS